MEGRVVLVASVKISIIMASYNCVSVIEQAILSVVNQTYNNIEFIIIDGGSTDGTVDILKKYNKKISYWISEPDKGIYEAFNKGINIATGDYIYFLGSDDSLINNNIITDVVNDLEDIDFYSGAVYCVEENGKQFTIDGIDETRLDMIPHQGVFTKTSFLKKRPFDTTYKIVADYDHYLYMTKILKVNIKRTSMIIAFYSTEGISSVDDNCRKENNIVRKKYNLPLLKKGNQIKVCISNFLRIIGILNWQRKIRGAKSYRKYMKHSCNNKVCRWCGRK